MNSAETETIQKAACRQYGRDFVPCPLDSKIGLAIQTLGESPIHGLRHPPMEGISGLYIWAGDYSEDKSFFQPLHASHLAEQLPEAVRFLGLPPGSRFLLAGDHIDIWLDESLLDV